MVYEVPGSHFWSDIDTMINWFTLSPTIDREYVLKGLANMKALGYCIVPSSKQQAPGSPRKPHTTNNYAAALRVFYEWVKVCPTFTKDCDWGDFEVWLREHLNDENLKCPSCGCNKSKLYSGNTKLYECEDCKIIFSEDQAKNV